MPVTSQSPTTNVQVKGALLNEMLRVLVKDLGQQAYEACLAALQPPFRDAIHKKAILDGAWYEVSWANDIMLQGYAKCAKPKEMAHASGRQCVTNLLRGVHRFLINAVTPPLVMRNASIFFRTYYRNVTIEGRTTSEHAGSFTATHFDNMGAELWYAIAGGSQTLLEGAGGKNVRAWVDETKANNIAIRVDICTSWS